MIIKVFDDRSMEGAVGASYGKLQTVLRAMPIYLMQRCRASSSECGKCRHERCPWWSANIICQIYGSSEILPMLRQIADFQNIEYKGKVYALIAEVQRRQHSNLRRWKTMSAIVSFAPENLEHECAELLDS